MKISTLLTPITAALLCSYLQAGQVPKPHDMEYRPEQQFTEFKGAEVRNLQNEKLGTLSDVTVDLQNGRLVEVVVSSGGGFLGIGERRTSVAPRALALDAANGVLRLDVSKEKFAAAPQFHRSNMNGASALESLEELNRYYGLKPWFFEEGQATKKNAKILVLGHVERGTHIIGLPVVDTGGRMIGRVSVVKMDLLRGQIPHVVVSTGDTESARSVIQARALRFTPSKNALILDDSAVELAGEPHFKWLHGSRTAFQQESYVNRKVEADAGLHSRQNVQDGIVKTARPMEQGKNFRDEQKTRRILQAIQADPTLSANAKNVEVATLNAQTTLRGHVNSAEGKRKIGKIAAKAGRPENVSNLLEVRSIY
ncbi:MAG: PRC-barrel domain-containing protein [Verrucomicrobiae bacterium]